MEEVIMEKLEREKGDKDGEVVERGEKGNGVVERKEGERRGGGSGRRGEE
jgi:hypothetical protein